MPTKPAALVALAAATGALFAWGSAGVGAAPPDGTRVFQSKPRANPGVRVVLRDDTADVGIAVECGGFDLSGRYEVRLRRGNRIRVARPISGAGTDTYEMDLELAGRLSGDRLSGTAHVEGRAFDNAGETGTCDEDYDWSARHAPKTGLGAIEAVVPVDGVEGDVHLAASADAVYAVNGDPVVVHRIDPESDAVASSTEIGGVADAVAATGDAVWLLDAANGEVRRFDPATEEVVATVDIGAFVDDVPYPRTNVVVPVGADVWAVSGNGQQLVEVDGATNEIGRTIELGGSLDSLASDRRFLYANVVEVALDADRTGDEPVSLRRIDPRSGEVATEIESDVSVELAAEGRTLWTAELLELVQRDSQTLDANNRVQVSALELLAARPGAWLVDDDVVVVDGAPEIVERVPALGADFGSLAAGFDSVWVWDGAGGVVVRVATG